MEPAAYNGDRTPAEPAIHVLSLTAMHSELLSAASCAFAAQGTMKIYARPAHIAQDGCLHYDAQGNAVMHCPPSIAKKGLPV